MSATQGHSGAMRAEDAVKDFWATRPRRPRRGRKIAGVAAGVANRYRIDPVLVRVGFVVATIYGGAGILFYLLGWLFLPEEDDEVSPAESLLGKGRSSTSSGFTILLGIVLVPVMGWFFGGSPIGTFPTWMSLVVIGGLLFLLHQSRGHLGPVRTSASTPSPEPTMPLTSAPMSTPVSTQPPPAAPQADAPLPPPVDAPPPTDERTTPPAWDPLGAAPFAWDLPEPAAPEPEEPPEPPVKRRKSRIGTMTVGLALVAAAGMSFAMGGWITPQHIVGVVLAILGLGMVAGAFLRGGRGLIALAVPLSVAGLALTVVSPGEYRGIGDLTAQPTTLAQVEHEYERSVGNVTVNLTSLTPGPGEALEDEPLEIQARTGIGNVEVIVPQDADVIVTCESERGNVECLDQGRSGLESKVEEYESLGEDGPGGLKIELEAAVNTGNVEVRRG